MLVIDNEAHYKAVLEFARSVGAEKQLQDQLEYLRDYRDESTRCHLYHDFAKHSFGFTMNRLSESGEESRWFNGGLIYSGPGLPLDGSAPQLTVGIGLDSRQHQWSVHT